MIKRNYKITPKEMSFGTTLKVEVWDKYGNYNCVYERNVMDASEHISNYWKTEDERNKSNELLSKAIKECQEIDIKSGILTGDRDGLD